MLHGLITAEASRAETRETAIDGRVSDRHRVDWGFEQLTTTAKTSLVAALNEAIDSTEETAAIQANAANIAINEEAISAETTRAENAEQVLRTTLNATVAAVGSATLDHNKTTVREAINELNAYQATLATQSTVESLETTVRWSRA